MEKLIIIGEFNDSLAEMNGLMSNGFTTQLCSPSEKIVASMLKMFEPDYILMDIEGFKAEHMPVFETIIAYSPVIPVVTYGTQVQKDAFSEYFKLEQFRHIVTPASIDSVAVSFCSMLGIDAKRILNNEALDASKPSVLVVDDNAVLLRNVKGMFADRYKTYLATSAAQCMKILGQTKIDLVVLDYEMPVCDGRQTLQMIRADEELKELPVVFLTGNSDKAHVDAVLELSPAAYFVKPPVQDKLIAAIDEILQRYGKM